MGEGRASQGKAGGAGRVGQALDAGFLSLCLDPERQAVQGVLCEGDSRQSRLLGLVRCRPERGGQEHA